MGKALSLKKFQQIISRKNREASEKQVIQIKLQFLLDSTTSSKQIDDQIELHGGTFSLTEHLSKKIEETQTNDPSKYLEYVQIQRALEDVGEMKNIQTESTKKRTKEKKPSGINLAEKIPKISISINKKWLMKLVIVGAITLAVSTGIFFVSKGLGNKEVREKEASISTYLDDRAYFKAAEEFPKEINTIEEVIVENKDFKLLEEFNQKYPTTEGEFDLAIFNQEWEKAIEVAETKEINLSFKRKVILTRSYITVDRLEEAQIFNKSIDSEEIAAEIDYGYFLRAVRFLQKGDFEPAKKIQEAIGNEELESLIKDAEIYQEMIDYYKKDQENKKHWENKLSNLGKEFLIDE